MHACQMHAQEIYAHKDFDWPLIYPGDGNFQYSQSFDWLVSFPIHQLEIVICGICCKGPSACLLRCHLGIFHPAALKMASLQQDPSHQHTAIDISVLESLIARSSVTCQQQQQKPPLSPLCTPPLAQVTPPRCISIRRRPWEECGSYSTPNTVRFCSATTAIDTRASRFGDQSPVKANACTTKDTVCSPVARKRTRSSDISDDDEGIDSASDDEKEALVDWQIADSDLSATDVDTDWEYESESSDDEDDELCFDYDDSAQNDDCDYEQELMARCRSVPPPPRIEMTYQTPVFPIFRPIATRTTPEQVRAARTIQATWRYVLTEQHASTLRYMYSYEREHSSAMPTIRARMKTIQERLNAMRFSHTVQPQPPFDEDWL